jgi:hypothetical protein
MTAHESEFFAGGDHFRHGPVKVRFFDDHPPSSLQNPQEVRQGTPLVTEMVKRVDNKYPIKHLIPEWKELRVGPDWKKIPLFPGLPQHVYRQIAHHDMIDEGGEIRRHPACSSSGIQHPTLSLQTEKGFESSNIRRPDQAVIHRRKNVKMSEHGGPDIDDG